MAYAVRGRSSALLAPSVHRGPRCQPAIALTFDDGPSPATIELLSILDEYSTKATFFACGVHVRKRPEIARAVSDAGHELGNHTESHPLLSLRSTGFIRNEIGRAQEAIGAATGQRPRWFRAPYGVRWFGLRTVQREFGLMGVMWTAIGRDWADDGDTVADRLVRAAGNGAILCLHDGRGLQAEPDIGSTLKAVRRVIPVLLGRGFRFVTLTELLCEQISPTA